VAKHHYPAYLPGAIAHKNQLEGYHTHITPPILFGDIDQAKLVLTQGTQCKQQLSPTQALSHTVLPSTAQSRLERKDNVAEEGSKQ
jgi:hypothetical protein